MDQPSEISDTFAFFGWVVDVPGFFDGCLDLLDGKIDTEEFKLDRFIRITMPSASNLAAFNKMLFFFLDLEREYYV